MKKLNSHKIPVTPYQTFYDISVVAFMLQCLYIYINNLQFLLIESASLEFHYHCEVLVFTKNLTLRIDMCFINEKKPATLVVNLPR